MATNHHEMVGSPTVRRSLSERRREEEEEELKWAAIVRLPTYNRMKMTMIPADADGDGGGRAALQEVDVTRLRPPEKKRILEKILKFMEEDNEKFLRRLRQRADRVLIESPEIEIRFENLTVEGNVYVGSRALPTLFNATLDAIESFLGLFRIIPTRKKRIQILKELSGIIKPARITLLLGPPSAGKTTLMLALAAKLDRDLKKSGRITYCGHEFNEFVPQRTCAYISQHDLHFGEMTARETLDFSGRCLGVGTRYEMLAELSRREKAAGIKPDPEIDAFMKAIAVSGKKTSLTTDYVLKILGLDICADTMVGDAMRRGISGGQKKRVTTGEMLVGPAKAFFMDEISTGLDSSTTFQICKYMKQMVHILDVTMVISLLQPAPETFKLFDDIILLSEGEIVYQGPREHISEFFEYMGFKCPERKGIADFLQEVTSLKDQEQYWYKKDQPYRYISVSEFRNGFESFHIGRKLSSDLEVAYDKSKIHPAALVSKRYGISYKDIFMACLNREWLLMKRNSFFYVFTTIEISITALITMSVFFRTEMQPGTLSGGYKFYGVLFFGLANVMFNGTAELNFTTSRLQVFYKQRDFLFYPSWAFALPMSVLRIPLSVLEAGVWVIFTYYTVGFAPSAIHFFKQFLAFFWLSQMALSMFRCVGGVGRNDVVSNTINTLVLLLTYVLGGFLINRNDIPPWLIWGYYTSPIMYAQSALVTNEFLDERWSKPNNDPSINATTVGEVLLKSRGFITDKNWYWICIGALIGFTILFNVLFILALTYLNPFASTKSLVNAEDKHTKKKKTGRRHETKGKDTVARDASGNEPTRGMTLPFQPLSLSYDHVNYYVDLPAEMKAQGVEGDRLHLLKDISGAFRPGILTALMGVSGAGKTTLMDVLAGRKTGGYIEGTINLAGYPKKQSTFARISGYCEQNDIHSPTLTVYESLLFSAWLRLSSDVDSKTREMFVQEVMELIELKPLKDSIVGLPGIDGLSTEQRKRLTIAVELVANPSIIFMDEPTSGLDARAAAIVMRTVRNTVDTGRTVVCTIHQPSIDIFEAFDELLLMKRGGEMIYAGPLGHNSHKLIQYFEAVPNVQKIWDGYNPATWMLEITANAVETRLGVDFAEIYANSSLYQRNQELIKEVSNPVEGSKDLHFPTEYSQPFLEQCKACFWKMFWSYWRNPQYNGMRFLITLIHGVMLGLIFWQKGKKTARLQDLTNFLGAMYGAVLFVGINNIIAVQPVVDTERTVFYREKAAGMYSPIPYAFAQVAVETIYNVIQGVVYCILLYPTIGLEWTPAKFFWFLFFIITSFLYFTLCGMMFVSITPNRNIAIICASFIIGLWNLFSGFLVPRTQLPIWWRWYYWGSPTAWTLYGIVASQVGDKNSNLQIPGVGNIEMKKYIRESLGFDYDFLPVVAVVHVGFILLYVLCFAYGIKFFNFQKR